MKKLTVILLAALLLGGCGNSAEMPQKNSETSQTAAGTTTAVTTAAEKVTTAKTETSAVTTEEAVPLTPLEEAQAWADEYPYRFLYDLTGDGFPERFNIREGSITSSVYDITWQYIYMEDKFYVCRDNDGRIFLAACYGGYEMAGCTTFYASRYDFYSNCVIETNLGEAEVFFTPYGYDYENERKYYTAAYEFLGDSSERAELINSSTDVVYGRLKNRLAEYISGYELIDTIVLDRNNKNDKLIVSFDADTDFAEEASDDLPEYEITQIDIGDFKYEIYGNYVRINADALANSFDFDVLNEFKELDHIEFDWLSYEPEEKVKIPKGDWCGRIKKMRININHWDTTDFSLFSNVESIIIDGWGTERADLEFLKDMPSVRYIYAYFTANSAETFIPLSEMPDLEAIIDSGHGGCMWNLSAEEQKKVMELLPEDKYFWGMVK